MEFRWRGEGRRRKRGLHTAQSREERQRKKWLLFVHHGTWEEVLVPQEPIGHVDLGIMLYERVGLLINGGERGLGLFKIVVSPAQDQQPLPSHSCLLPPHASASPIPEEGLDGWTEMMAREATSFAGQSRGMGWG